MNEAREQDLLNRSAAEIAQYQAQSKCKERAFVLKLFGLLRSMHALVSIEEDSVFLRYGYLSPSNVAAVIKEVANLCSELRPH
ncbi:putative acyl-coenzyme A oxidase [Acorus calamus]|uniref:Acyl-coenzyme A oxidase n=1 Tax=Acorus calamus TaxID=4465 RepID=A0AAV9DZ30_ACOCL|nr:putative acyl-coenzyme A oxidase [Acorus calamus]